MFPTEDDRLDVPAIMLFQAYTACRPAELVDGTKCRGASDPMLDDSDVEDAGSSERVADDVVMARGGQTLPRRSGTSNRRMNQKWKPTIKPGYERVPESGSDAGSSLDESLHDPVFDSDDESGDGESDDGGDGDDTSDTEYSHDEDEDVDMLLPDPGLGQPSTTDEQDGEKETMRLHKALCYEDIVLWIVRNPNRGGRDVLAMEVLFRHHKGADKKPKPYVLQ